MNVTITGRKCSPRQSFIAQAEKRLAKFDRFFNGEADANVTATAEKNSFTVEITVKNRGFLFRSERTAADLDTAFSDAADLMMRQIVKNKEKLGSRVRTQEVELAGAEIEPDTETNESVGYQIAREKFFHVEPMSEQEAILQMEMLGHSFFMFRNSSSGEINIVYKRHDDTYGLLIPKE